MSLKKKKKKLNLQFLKTLVDFKRSLILHIVSLIDKRRWVFKLAKFCVFKVYVNFC